MVLLPTNNLGRETSKLELAGELSIWALTGVAIHAFAVGLQKRPLLSSTSMFV